MRHNYWISAKASNLAREISLDHPGFWCLFVLYDSPDETTWNFSVHETYWSAVNMRDHWMKTCRWKSTGVLMVFARNGKHAGRVINQFHSCFAMQKAQAPE